MALNNTIRRVSRVVPFSIRAFAGSQRYLHHHQGSAAVHHPLRNFFPGALPSAIQHYCSKPESDESLLRVLNSEIRYAVESQVKEKVAVPEGFPFEIEDHLGQQTITLTREYNGENITVEVHMPNFGGSEEDEEQGNQSFTPMVVRISKNNGPNLEFGCTAYADEIAIDSLSIKDLESSEDQIAYEGPDFGDLDENLQKSLHNYLEIRGITPSTTNFLCEYMVNKDSREYVRWLENIQKFIQA